MVYVSTYNKYIYTYGQRLRTLQNRAGCVWVGVWLAVHKLSILKTVEWGGPVGEERGGWKNVPGAWGGGVLPGLFPHWGSISTSDCLGKVAPNMGLHLWLLWSQAGMMVLGIGADSTLMGVCVFLFEFWLHYPQSWLLKA